MIKHQTSVLRLLTLPFASLALAWLPGSLRKEWKSIVCRTDMSAPKALFRRT